LQKISLTLPKSQPLTPPITQTPTPDTHPSAAIESYPNMALSYTGTLHDALRNMDATLSLVQIKQDEQEIRGYYTVEARLANNDYYSMQSILIERGYLTGIVTTDNKVRFLISSDGSSLPLLFEGQFQPDGSISGTYCSYWNNQCDNSSGEHGSWHVAPQAAE
jgi:eukaryotic-like serine/threonine-protein kinase